MNEALHFEVEPVQRFGGKSQPVKRPKVRSILRIIRR